MARLVTSGAGLIEHTSSAGPDGGFTDTANLVTNQATVFRISGRAWKFTNNTAQPGAIHFFTFTAPGVGVATMARVYFRVENLPTTTDFFMNLGSAGTGGGLAAIKFTTTGTFQLFNNNGGVQIGSDSPAISAGDGVWHRLELLMQIGTGTVDVLEAKLDGVTFAQASGLGVSDTQPTALNVNFSTGSWPNGAIVYYTDVAVNDASGSVQNSFPGEGHVVLAVPASDSAVGTGWTLGTGTAIASNSGSVAVKNTPPVGVADLTAGSDTKQIRNATSNANVNYDANLATYSSLGILPDDTITVLDPIISTAAPVTTSAKQGTVGVVSNPAIANIALSATGTSGAFWAGTAAAAYPTGWKWSHGTITYNPSVTLGTAPVMRVTQVTSSTRIAMVDFMGMYIEYVPARPRRQNRRLAGNMARDWQDF